MFDRWDGRTVSVAVLLVGDHRARFARTSRGSGRDGQPARSHSVDGLCGVPHVGPLGAHASGARLQSRRHRVSAPGESPGDPLASAVTSGCDSMSPAYRPTIVRAVTWTFIRRHSVRTVWPATPRRRLRRSPPSTCTHDPAFPLTGAHLQITCESCHENERGGAFSALDGDCVSCHLPDYQRSDIVDHASRGFPTTCEQCHGSLAWQATEAFDHTAASGGFDLAGAHDRRPLRQLPRDADAGPTVPPGRPGRLRRVSRDGLCAGALQYGIPAGLHHLPWRGDVVERGLRSCGPVRWL